MSRSSIARFNAAKALVVVVGVVVVGVVMAPPWFDCGVPCHRDGPRVTRASKRRQTCGKPAWPADGGPLAAWCASQVGSTNAPGLVAGADACRAGWGPDRGAAQQACVGPSCVARALPGRASPQRACCALLA